MPSKSTEQPRMSLVVPMVIAEFAAFTLYILSKVLLTGTIMFWAHTVSVGLMAFFFVPLAIHEAREFPVAGARGEKVMHKLVRLLEVIVICIGTLWAIFSFIAALMDIPYLSHPLTMTVTDVNPETFHYRHFRRVIYATDKETKEHVQLIAPKDVYDDYLDAQQQGGGYFPVSGTITYLPSSRIALSSDLHSLDADSLERKNLGFNAQQYEEQLQRWQELYDSIETSKSEASGSADGTDSAGSTDSSDGTGDGTSSE